MSGLSWLLFTPNLARTLVFWHDSILLQMSSILPHCQELGFPGEQLKLAGLLDCVFTDDQWGAFYIEGLCNHPRSQGSLAGPPNMSPFCLHLCPSFFLLSCGKGVKEDRWSARGSPRAAKWEQLTVGRSFCCSKAAANVVDAQRRQCRPLMLHCISLECTLEIGFTLCSFFPLRLIGYRTHMRPCAVMVEALWCPRELSQWQNIQ